MATLQDMGFAEIGGGKLLYMANTIDFARPFVFERDEDIIELHLCKEGLKCRLLVDKENSKYDEFVFVSNFVNFEPLSRSAVDELTREILTKYLPTQKFTPISNERFYKYLRFHSFDDLKTQMKAYLKRSNNIPISTLCSQDKTKKWLTPNEKRKELLLLDWGVIE